MVDLKGMRWGQASEACWVSHWNNYIINLVPAYDVYYLYLDALNCYSLYTWLKKTTNQFTLEFVSNSPENNCITREVGGKNFLLLEDVLQRSHVHIPFLKFMLHWEAHSVLHFIKLF